MSLNLLKDELTTDLIDRKEILLTTKTFAYRYRLSEVDEKFFITYSIPLVYSVWEGFIQTSFQSYIRAINRLGLNIEDLPKSILVFVIENKFKQFKQYPELKKNSKETFLYDLQQFFKNDEILDIIPIINTQSNVSFDVMNKILLEFNLLEIPEYLEVNSGYSIKNELKRFVLQLRNNIAHGNNSIIVEADDLIRSINLVELLMDEIVERILSGFENKKYLNS